jgi:hypothetical protein
LRTRTGAIDQRGRAPVIRSAGALPECANVHARNRATVLVSDDDFINIHRPTDRPMILHEIFRSACRLSNGLGLACRNGALIVTVDLRAASHIEEEAYRPGAIRRVLGAMSDGTHVREGLYHSADERFDRHGASFPKRGLRATIRQARMRAMRCWYEGRSLWK